MKMPWVISRKLIYLGFFAVISAALATFSLFLYDRYSKVQDLDRYTLYQYEVVRQSRLILSDMVDMETGVRGYVLTGDRKFLDPYYGADFRLRDEIVHLRNSTYFEQHSFAETNTWLDQIVGLQKQLKAQIDAVDVNGRGAVRLKDLEAQRQTMSRLRNIMDASMNVRLRDLQAKTRAVEAHRNDFLFSLLMGTALSVGILLLGTVIIIRLELANEKSEEERTRAEQRFRTVMDGVNDGLWEYNFVRESLYASKEFKAMLGYEDDELPSTLEAVEKRIHPDDLPKTIEHRRAYAAREIPVYNSVFRMKHKDGTWRWVMSRGVGLWDRHGEIRTLTGTHTDITEQKNREEELRQLHADMEAFTYITSHDMRSPLVNLKGFSHELRLAVSELDSLIEPQKDKLDEGTWPRVETFLRHDIPEALGFIGNAVDRMDTLTTAILDLSRIGKYVYRDETVDSRAIIDKCLGAQSYEIGNKKVEVVVGDLPKLVTDPVALEQIFSNLIDNAVKYLKPDRPGRIEIACFATNRDYIFSIRDNGRGIEAEDSQKVFHIFRRARNTGDVRGLGLGMAFVKATLRKLNGSIWFDSTLDAGTTFYISLPRKEGAAVKAPDTDTVPDAGARAAPDSKSARKGIAV
ncbi:MAG: sensor histidine kinase [Asticcacaulis sp.]